MTAWASIELAVEAMQGGGQDFVQKPWDNEKLLRLLRRHVEQGRLLREQMREKKREEDEAREIQQRLLPSAMPQLCGLDLRAFWKPAKEVGGDYFDAIRLTDSKLAFCIGDVAGKGMPAALLMSNMQPSVRGLAPSVSSPAQMCRQLNRVVLENARSERFTTFFYGIIDSARGVIRYSNAGHVPPILVLQDGTISRLSEGGTVLGVFSNTEFAEGEVAFSPGSRLILVTDGITEATGNQGEEFGEARLMSLLREHRHLDAGELQQTLLNALALFAGQAFHDDATLMIISKRHE
jgi:sigma-B regulation protein RsbU (phosphoserine phosphatase)